VTIEVAYLAVAFPVLIVGLVQVPRGRPCWRTWIATDHRDGHGG
jgi:hypothetical protein